MEQVHPRIIYEHRDFLAVVKPAGLLVHGVIRSKSKAQSSKPTEPTLVDWLLKYRPEVRKVGDEPVTRPGIVHRLDKDTSGVMLVPKTQEYYLYLKGLFQRGEIRKTYLALVRGRMRSPEGIIEKPIGIVSGSTRRSTRSAKMQKSAVTAYRLKHEFETPSGEALSLLEVYPKTGRTHQIRVHLSSIGHPIVGDPLYGPRNPKSLPRRQAGQIPASPAGRPSPKRLMLHALSLEFAPEPGKRLKIEAEPPIEFRILNS